MEAITYLAALSMALSGSGSTANAELVGTWRVQLSPEVRETAKKMGMPEPQAQFIFNADKTFAFTSSAGGNSKNSNGTYELSDHAIKLLALNNDWPSDQVVELRDHALNVNGLRYVKQDATSIAGLWTLRTDSGEDRSIKIQFDKEGNFSFTGQFATSKGHYTLDGDSVNLVWTEIDGEKVDGNVHKTVPLTPDGVLKIDTFRYMKQ
ncbi:MAG TPA: hypothetical protein VGL56_19505 [Fimbriimonadaceae bacterium]|jgi:hypothetical protein